MMPACKLELVGGPHDGMMLAAAEWGDGWAPEVRIPLEAQNGIVKVVILATYKRRHTIRVAPGMVTVLPYDFAGIAPW